MLLVCSVDDAASVLRGPCTKNIAILRVTLDKIQFVEASTHTYDVTYI